MRQQPEFVRYFFWEHNVNRFLAGTFHPQPIWFFLPVAFLGFMPWGLLLFPLCGFLFRRSAQFRAMRPLPLGYLLLWSVWCVGFFSISRGKLPPYILPAAPAVALMVGCLIDRTCSPFAIQADIVVKSLKTFRMGTLLVCVAGGILGIVAVMMRLVDWHEGMIELSLWTAAFGLVWFNRQRFSPRVIWLSFCMAAFAIAMDTAHELFPAWAEQNQMIVGGDDVERQLHDDQTPLAFIGGRWGSVPFYLERSDVQLIDNIDSPELPALLSQHRGTICYVDDRYSIAEFQKALPAGSTCEKLADTSKAAIVRVSGPEPGRLKSLTDDEVAPIRTLTSTILQVVAELPVEWTTPH